MSIALLLFGICLTEMDRNLMQISSSDTEDALNQAVEQAGKRSVLSRNRLRR